MEKDGHTARKAETVGASHDNLIRNKVPKEVLNLQPLSPASVGPSHDKLNGGPVLSSLS